MLNDRSLRYNSNNIYIENIHHYIIRDRPYNEKKMVRGDRGTHLLGAEKRVRHMKLTTVFFPDSQTFAAPRAHLHHGGSQACKLIIYSHVHINISPKSCQLQKKCNPSLE
jgi:hypothetical protein